MLLPSSMQPMNCDWCRTKLLMSFAEKLFFLRSSSSFNRLELIKDISTPEKSADARSDIMTTNQLLIVIQFNGCAYAEYLAVREVIRRGKAVAENQFVGT